MNVLYATAETGTPIVEQPPEYPPALDHVVELCQLDGVDGFIYVPLDSPPLIHAELRKVSDALYDFATGFIRFGSEECSVPIDDRVFYYGKYDHGVFGVALHRSAPASVRKSIRRTMRRVMRRCKGL